MNESIMDGTCYGSTVLEWLEAIERARGVKAKRDLICNILETADAAPAAVLKQTFKYAYDQSIRFGVSIGSISSPVTAPRGEKTPFDLNIFSVLDHVILESSVNRKVEQIENLLAEMDVHSRVVLLRILDKDLRCGINESTLNKVLPDLLTKFSVMLAKAWSVRHVDAWPVAVEPKLDGLRCIAEVNVATGTVDFFTRSGKPITSLNNFKPELVALANEFKHDFQGDEVTPTVAFDGEVTSGSFLESMSNVRKSTEQVEEGTFHIFDVLTRTAGLSPLALDDSEIAEQGGYVERRKRLTDGWLKFCSKLGYPKPKFLSLTPSYRARSENEVMTLYENARDQGFEGLIVKSLSAPYVKKRAAAWMKIKAEETLDLPIVGAFEGTGKYEGQLGGLIVRYEGVDVRVGSGFSDAQRHDMWVQFKKDLAAIDAGNRSECRLIDVPAEIQYQEKLPSGSLRHPVFVRLRYDKHATTGVF